jgi:hypothetical protein
MIKILKPNPIQTESNKIGLLNTTFNFTNVTPLLFKCVTKNSSVKNQFILDMSFLYKAPSYLCGMLTMKTIGKKHLF